MKKTKWLFVLLLSGLLVAGCDEPLQNEPEQTDPTEQTDPDNPQKPDPKPDPKPEPKVEYRFVAYFENYDAGEGQMGLLEVYDNHEVKIQKIDMIFRYENILEEATQGGHYVAILAKPQTDEYKHPLLMDLKTLTVKKLPKLSYDEDSKGWVDSSRPILSPNGKWVAYPTHINCRGDMSRQTRVGLYDVEKGELLEMKDHVAYIRSQPEFDDSKQSKIEISSDPGYFTQDGRYLFGSMSCYTYGWAVSLDFKIVYRYDIKKKEYKRLNPGKLVFLDKVVGLSSDDKYIYVQGYTDSSFKTYKMDAQTGEVVTIYDGLMDFYVHNYSNHFFSKNQWAYGKYLYQIKDGKYIQTELKNIPAKSTSVLCTQFNKDRTKVFFLNPTEKGNELCLTKSLKSDTEYDVLATLPSDLVQIFVIYNWDE